MTLGLGDERRRRRQRARFARGLFLFAASVAILGTAYYFGHEQAQGEIEGLNARIVELTDTSDRLAKTKGELEAALVMARRQIQDLEMRYDRDVPKGPSRELHRLSQAKIAEGVSAGRIAAVIGLLQSKRVCDEPQTKRFYVKVPLYNGGATQVGFGPITVSGTGEEQTNSRNQPEAFYDPEKPVKIEISGPNGLSVPVEGVVPVEGNVIAGGYEWRVKVAKGARGFANVTADRCRFP